jgi:hypothetical protein
VETSVPHRLTLEVANSAASIAGRMSDEDGVTVEFGGWLELAAALQRFLNDDAGETSAAP